MLGPREPALSPAAGTGPRRAWVSSRGLPGGSVEGTLCCKHNSVEMLGEGGGVQDWTLPVVSTDARLAAALHGEAAEPGSEPRVEVPRLLLAALCH